jgi:hypothetical protein
MLGLGVAGSFTAETHADSRPFGVLPEGAVSITRGALGTDATVLTDGRLVIQGTHNRIDGLPHEGVAVLRPDGSLDRSFQFDCLPRSAKAQGPNCNGRTVALPDGGFVLGGSFEQVNGLAVARLARFAANGSLIPLFQPLSGITNLRSVRVIKANGVWLYLVLDIDGSVSLRRVSLESGSLDPGFVAAGPSFDFAITAADRVYEFAQVAGTSTFVLRRRQPDGSVDAVWQSGITDPASLGGYDPQSDRLFVMTTSSDGQVRVRRVHPETGLEPGWVAELPPTGFRGANLSIVAMAPGRLLTRIQSPVTGASMIAVHDTATGSLQNSRQPPAAVRSFFPGRDDQWYAAVEFADDPVVPDGGSFVRLGPDLQIDPGFISRSRRTGLIAGAAITPDGGVVITGEFSRVGNQPRFAMARLEADYSLRPDWPLTAVPMVLPASIAISREDITLIRAAPTGAIIPIPPPGQLFFVALTPGGRAWRSHQPPAGPFEIASDGQLYSLPTPCWPKAGPRPALGRMPLAPLIQMPGPGIPLPPCFADPEWGVPEGAQIADFATTPNGPVYFLEREESSGFRDLRVRRIALTAGSAVDPGFAPLLGAAPGPTQSAQARIRANADHIYLAGSFAQVNGQAATGLVRLGADTGELDSSWPGLPINTTVFRVDLDTAYAYVGGLRFTSGEPGTASVSSGSVVRRAIADGSRAGTVEALAFSRPLGLGPWMSITPFGDGRLLAVGAFRVIDGQPRDGFAILGSVETILAGGFEGSP